MASSKLQRAKGVRDFSPMEKLERDRIVNLLIRVFESYGYSPIETPVIERYDLFASKFGAGEQSDAMKETFKFQDQGARELVLRSDFTVPFARFVGMNQNLKMPFKRYQIGQIFRDGPLKLGRYREFWQADIDAVGIAAATFDSEFINIVINVFQQLGLDISIAVNNRKILNSVLDKFNIPAANQADVLIALDKLDKIQAPGVIDELKSKGIDIKEIDAVIELLTSQGGNEQLFTKFMDQLPACSGLVELRQMLSLVNDPSAVQFMPWLVRGQAYYTGAIFEVYLKDKSILSSSLAAGGRYDKMISGLIGQAQAVPAVGISFGLETIMDALEQSGKLDNRQSVTQIYVAIMDLNYLAPGLVIADKIRSAGFNVDVDYQARKLKKSLDYADSLGMDYVVIIGEDEIKQNQVMLRDMRSGQQTGLTVEQLIERLVKEKKQVI